MFVIDFRFIDREGCMQRYRRDASVQTLHGARAEASRLQLLAATHGTLETRREVPRLGSFLRGDFARLYLPKYRPSTRARYQGLLRQLTRALGPTRLNDIGPADARRLAASATEQGLTVKPIVTMLKTVLRAAEELGVIDDVPKFPKRLWRESRKLPQCPTMEEVSRMLPIGPDWLRNAVALGALGGLRMGEVLALEVRDIDLVERRLLVRRALSGGVVVTPKSGHERVVPLSDELRELLSMVVRIKLPKARLITMPDGATPRRTHVLRTLKRELKRAGLEPWSFHSLRHHFITEHVRSGTSVEVARKLAGHSSLSITQRYVHARAEDLAAAMDKRARYRTL